MNVESMDYMVSFDGGLMEFRLSMETDRYLIFKSKEPIRFRDLKNWLGVKRIGNLEEFLTMEFIPKLKALALCDQVFTRKNGFVEIWYRKD